MAECEEEVDVLVQRVVKDITNAFQKNPNIDEIGVISCPEARYNRSPIVLVENKLGVESWCVKFLLPYVHNKLLLYRQRKQWLDREALVNITSTLLLLNPDFTTAWNVRKELLQCGVLCPEKDLYLGKLALTKFPKSPETWIHRRWVLQQLMLSRQKLQGAPEADADRILQLSEQTAHTVQEEMRVCTDAANRYPSNYNAWSHRIWVLQHMAKGNTKFLHDELASTRPWVSMHVSDHSGFHYRQFLIQQLLAELSPMQVANNIKVNGGPVGHVTEVEDLTNLLQLLNQEMELSSDLIQSFPGHEALWCHRRHVFYVWQSWWREQQLSQNSAVDSEANGALCEEPVHGHRASGTTMEDGLPLPLARDRKRLKRAVLGLPSVTSEQSFVSAVLDSCSCPHQRRLALAYRKWLHTVLQLQL
uniref:Protein prenyltransferase alpha subunit repeat containing 1 n=1 Tax=Neogobius melanostomus TaxID=47308 RepID=A0A8C6WQM3_9GOBI